MQARRLAARVQRDKERAKEDLEMQHWVGDPKSEPTNSNPWPPTHSTPASKREDLATQRHAAARSYIDESSSEEEDGTVGWWGWGYIVWLVWDFWANGYLPCVCAWRMQRHRQPKILRPISVSDHPKGTAYAYPHRPAIGRHDHYHWFTAVVAVYLIGRSGDGEE